MTKIMLHIGCGPAGRAIPTRFMDYAELRMDIDPAVGPDVVGTILAIDMPDASVDAIYASHVLEHVERWEVGQALSECARVLKPGGEAVIVTPDLATWAWEIAMRPNDIERIGAVEAYKAPVTMLDALFGYQPDIQNGNDAMRHKTAFTAGTLAWWLVNAGFHGQICAQHYQLCAVVRKESDNGQKG